MKTPLIVVLTGFLGNAEHFFLHTTLGHLALTVIAVGLMALLAWKASGRIEKNQQAEHQKKAKEGMEIREKLGIEEHKHH